MAGTEKPGRGLRIALVISVGVNLMVAGIVGGALVQGWPGQRMARDLGFGPFSAALTPEDHAALRRGFTARAGDVRALRGQMRQEMTAMVATLRAEPFDPAALQAQMAETTARMGARMALGQELLTGHLLQMSAPERRAFADRLEAHLARRAGAGQPARD